MLVADSVYGNIFDKKDGKRFSSQGTNNYKKLNLTRHEMEKTRIRVKTLDGVDFGINLLPGIHLRHGDVLSLDSFKVLIEQLPEKVLTVMPKQTMSSEQFIMLGHIIGNRHRPISISNGVITLPIHDESEVELFRKLFIELNDFIEMSIQEQVFIPHKTLNVHDHG